MKSTAPVRRANLHASAQYPHLSSLRMGWAQLCCGRDLQSVPQRPTGRYHSTRAPLIKNW